MNNSIIERVHAQELILHELNYFHNISQDWKLFFWKELPRIYNTAPIQDFLLLCATNKILNLGKLWIHSANSLCFESLLKILQNSEFKDMEILIQMEQLFNQGINDYKSFGLDYVRDKYIAHRDINAKDRELEGKHISVMIAYSNKLHNLFRTCLNIKFEPFDYDTKEYDVFFNIIKASI